MIHRSIKILLVISFLLLGLSAFLTQARAQTSQETLNQYVADLQKNSEDNALREKIIKLVQGMKSAPKVPNEVDELVGKATYIFKNAKSEAEFNDAVEAYQKALLIAPWVPEYYFNLGTVQEKAGKFKEAVESFNFYLLAASEAKDAKEVREHIGGLKYAAEKAAKGPGSDVVAAQEQKTSEDWLNKLDGRRYTMSFSDGTMIIDVRGKVLVKGVIDVIDGGGVYKELTGEDARVEILGRETTIRLHPSRLNFTAAETFIISEDGDRITQRTRFNDGDVREFIFLWQR